MSDLTYGPAVRLCRNIAPGRTRRRGAECGESLPAKMFSIRYGRLYTLLNILTDDTDVLSAGHSESGGIQKSVEKLVSSGKLHMGNHRIFCFITDCAQSR